MAAEQLGPIHAEGTIPVGIRLEVGDNGVNVMRCTLTSMLLSLHRIAVFNFQVDEKQKKPTVEFISEEPYLQYVSSCNDIVKFSMVLLYPLRRRKKIMYKYCYKDL